jgi:ketosteroid isomerase-like protein
MIYMKRVFSIIIVLMSATIMSGQQLPAPLQGIVDAENGFADLSKRTDTRTSFLANLADSVVLFDQGKPVVGTESWIKRKTDSTFLFWWPLFVGISKDEHLGFSVGPWQWAKSRADQPVAFGYYITMWEKDMQGKWKVAVDLGIRLPQGLGSLPALTASLSPAPVTKQPKDIARKQLLDLDQRYIIDLNKKAVSYQSEYFTADGRLMRSESGVYVSPSNFNAYKDENSSYQFTQAGGGISSAQDLGYTYGTLVTESTIDGKKTPKTRSYMRIWKREKTGWKVVVDVITP